VTKTGKGEASSALRSDPGPEDPSGIGPLSPFEAGKKFNRVAQPIEITLFSAE
jgi:hypothetical protein